MYKGIHHCVTGSHHVRRCKPCQDYSFHLIDNRQGWAIASVADGHGASHCFRSGEGSRLSALIAAQELFTLVRDCQSPPAMEAMIALKRSILTRWHAAVEAHFAEHPLTEAEAPLFEGNIPTVYGSTLRAALVTEAYTLLLSLGDGSITVIDADGKATQPIPEDNLPGETTYSLCLPDAYDYFNHVLIPGSIAAVALGTDGLDKSFATADDLVQAIRDCCELVYKDEHAATETVAANLLRHCAVNGRGDDTSIALIVNTNLLPQPGLSPEEIAAYRAQQMKKTADLATLLAAAQQALTAAQAQFSEVQAQLAVLLQPQPEAAPADTPAEEESPDDRESKDDIPQDSPAPYDSHTPAEDDTPGEPPADAAPCTDAPDSPSKDAPAPEIPTHEEERPGQNTPGEGDSHDTPPCRDDKALSLSKGFQHWFRFGPFCVPNWKEDAHDDDAFPFP